jgi:hypothetical protein
MAEEIQEAAQIIRVALEGIQVAMKIGGGGLGLLKSSVTFLAGMLEHEKLSGKTKMKELLKRGGDLQVLRFKSEDMKKVAKLAKKYGILFSAVPKAGRETGMSEIVFHSEAVPRANMLLQKLTDAKIINYDEFLAKKEENQVGKLLEYLKKLGGRAEPDNEPTEVQQELADKIKAAAFSKDTQMVDVTMSKSLIASEGERSLKVRIPGTWGENVRYLWIPKDEIIDIRNGKSMLTFFNKDREYEVYDRGGKAIKTATGAELLKNYDRVSASVRKNAEAVAKDILPEKTIVPEKGGKPR